MWDLHPFGYHLTGILLQAANALLVFALMNFCFGNPSLAFWTSLIFSTHYLSWLWVFEQGQNDQQLLVVFYVLSTIFLLRHVATGRKSLQLSSILFFICALLSRELAATTILSFPFWLIAHENAQNRRPTNIWRRYWLYFLRLKYYHLVLAAYLFWRIVFIGVVRRADEGSVYAFYLNPLDSLRHLLVYVPYAFYECDVRNLALFFGSALTTIIAMYYSGNIRDARKYFTVPLFSILPLAIAVFICPLIIPALLQPPHYTALWHLSLSILGMSILYAAFIDTTLNVVARGRTMRYWATAIIYILIISFPIRYNRLEKDYWPRLNSAALKYASDNKIGIAPDAAILIKGIETESAFEDSCFRDFFKLYWGDSVDVGFLPSNAPLPPAPPVRRPGAQIIIFKFENDRLLLAE